MCRSTESVCIVCGKGVTVHMNSMLTRPVPFPLECVRVCSGKGATPVKAKYIYEPQHEHINRFQDWCPFYKALPEMYELDVLHWCMCAFLHLCLWDMSLKNLKVMQSNTVSTVNISATVQIPNGPLSIITQEQNAHNPINYLMVL